MAILDLLKRSETGAAPLTSTQHDDNFTKIELAAARAFANLSLPVGAGLNAPLLMGWVSGSDVLTSGSNVTAVNQAYGLGSSLTPDLAGGTAPTILADGGISCHANGTSFSNIQRALTAASRMLFITVVHVDSDTDGSLANLMAIGGAEDFTGGYGFELAPTAISAMVSAGVQTSSTTNVIVAGRQVVSLYINFATNTWRIKSLHEDYTYREASGTFPSAPADPAGHSVVGWSGSYFSSAGVQGRTNVWGAVLLSLPTGYTAAQIDLIALGWMGKLAGDAFSVTRSLPAGSGTENGLFVPVDGRAAALNIQTIDNSNAGQRIYIDQSLTVSNTFAAGLTAGFGVWVILFNAHASNELTITVQAGAGGTGQINGATSYVIPAGGEIMLFGRSNAGDQPQCDARGDSTTLNFNGRTVRVGMVRPTHASIGNGYAVVATDAGRWLYANATGTATVASANTLCPNAEDAFSCVVVCLAATFTLTLPSATAVNMVQNEVATIFCRNNSSVRAVKGLAVA